jgi:hypothetical protein
LTSLAFLKFTSLWFQYSTHRWSGSRASIAWKYFSQNQHMNSDSII